VSTVSAPNAKQSNDDKRLTSGQITLGTTQESQSIDARIAGIIRPLVINRDERGSVRETFRDSWFGIPPIKQLVQSESKAGVMRAMHLHRRQYDVWHFTAGEAYVQLYTKDSEAPHAIWAKPDTTIVIPPLVAHGFYAPYGCTLVYALTEEYDGTDEFGFDALDPDYPGSKMWPEPLASEARDYIRSDRDRKAAKFRKFAW